MKGTARSLFFGHGEPYAVKHTTAGMQEVERIRRQSRATCKNGLVMDGLSRKLFPALPPSMAGRAAEDTTAWMRKDSDIELHQVFMTQML